MAVDLTFPERAVRSFVLAADARKISPRHVRDVIKYSDVDVMPIMKFLKHDDPWVRKCAVQVIGARGNKRKLIEMTMDEDDRYVLIEICNQLTNTKEGLEDTVALLVDEDVLIREAAINMFRRAGRADCLMTMLFDKDDEVVNRARRYMREMDERRGRVSTPEE